MEQKLLSLFFVLTCLVGVSYAQNRQVSGKVTSATDGTPISGVSVSVVGTSTATQTDGSGTYSISVSEGTALDFSYVGHTAQRITVGNQSVINVQLVNDSESLEEVVVVGYGTATKESFTGSAKKLSSENIERKNVSNISQALAGEIAGVNIINTTGQPGTDATIRIRGLGSVNGNRDPLYVVDGVPYTGNLTSLNNADIESVTVLKDGTATAIYGSRGANGVIMVTTKSGRGQKPFIEADFNFGTNAQLLPRYDVITSPEEYIGLSWEALYNYAGIRGVADPTTWANTRLFDEGWGMHPLNNMWNVTDGSDLIDPVSRTVKSGVTRKFDPENWRDYAFQNAARTDINVKVGGSSESSNYYTSFGYLNDKGYSINSDFERFSARVNLDNKVKSWLNTGVNLSFSRTNRNNSGQTEDSGSIFWFMDNIPSIYPLFERDANGDKIPELVYGGYVFDYGRNNQRKFANATNAIADATYGSRLANRNEINGRAYANFNIIEGLTFENSLAINYYHNKRTLRDSKFYGQSFSTKGSIAQQRTETFSYTLLNLLRYKTHFGANHNFEALAAHESQDFSNNYMSGSKNQLVRDDSNEFDNAVVTLPFSSYEEGFAVESYFGQVNYDYQSKYYLSGSIRRDGSSRFINHKWGTFGSIGAGWIVSKEDFMQDQHIFDYLKFKLSYGVIGDQSVGAYYPGYKYVYPISNLDGQPAIGSTIVGNPDLTWEKAKMFQTGLEFEVGKYLTGSLEYYVKNTTDLIFDRRVAPSNGYALYTVNDGRLLNKGFEFDLTGHLVKTSDFYLDLGLNGEIFRNRITRMPIEPSTGQPKIVDPQSPFGWAEGRSVYDFYIRDYMGVDPDDGLAKWKVFYIDTDGDGQFDDSVDKAITSLADFNNANNDPIVEGETKSYQQATLHFVDKSAIPDIRGAINLSAGYKGFSVATQFLYSIGGYGYDVGYATLMANGAVGANNWHKDILNRWQKEGDVTDVPRLSNDWDANVASTSTRFLTKSDYLALNNIRLGYNFGQDLIRHLGISVLSVWVSGDNLWITAKRDGYNPMIYQSGTSSMYTYAPLSTFSAGLRAKF